MPRQTHIAQVPLGSIGDYSVPNSADLNLLAGDVANEEQTALTGKEMIILDNNSGGANTLAVTSVPNQFGRTKDINFQLDPGEHGMFGPFDLEGWRQADGNLYFSVTSVFVGIGIIRLP